MCNSMQNVQRDSTPINHALFITYRLVLRCARFRCLFLKMPHHPTLHIKMPTLFPSNVIKLRSSGQKNRLCLFIIVSRVFLISRYLLV
jgi:hypothetical protein